jgi:hypothetical protein
MRNRTRCTAAGFVLLFSLAFIPSSGGSQNQPENAPATDDQSQQNKVVYVCACLPLLVSPLARTMSVTPLLAAFSASRQGALTAAVECCSLGGSSTSKRVSAGKRSGPF